jgi:hypothetical protein
MSRPTMSGEPWVGTETVSAPPRRIAARALRGKTGRWQRRRQMRKRRASLATFASEGS